MNNKPEFIVILVFLARIERRTKEKKNSKYYSQVLNFPTNRFWLEKIFYIIQMQICTEKLYRKINSNLIWPLNVWNNRKFQMWKTISLSSTIDFRNSSIFNLNIVTFACLSHLSCIDAMDFYLFQASNCRYNRNSFTFHYYRRCNKNQIALPITW